MPVSRPTLRLLVLPGLSFALLAGCASSNPCGGNQDYLSARNRPQLQLPEGVTGSERLGGSVLAIPMVDPNPDKLDPAPACIDQPPGFFRRAGGVADAADALVAGIKAHASS
jgi:hypothetical protein